MMLRNYAGNSEALLTLQGHFLPKQRSSHVFVVAKNVGN